MIEMREADDTGLVSSDSLKMLPKTCKCGAQILASDSMHRMQCSDPKCPYSTAERMHRILSKLKGNVALNVCEYICVRYKVDTPMQIFELAKKLENGSIQDEVLDETGDTANVIAACKRYQIQKRQDWEIIRDSNIEVISRIAHRIFGEFKSAQQAYEKVLNFQGETAVAKRLGMDTREGSIVAVEIARRLVEHREEILYITTFVKGMWSENVSKPEDKKRINMI